MARRTSKKRTSKRRTSKRRLPRIAPNYTPPQRGWTMAGEDESDPDEEGSVRDQIRREMINKLAAEWNEAHSRMEARSFRSDEERESEDEAMSEIAQDRAWDAVEAWATANGIDTSSFGRSQHTWPEEAQKVHQSAVDSFYEEHRGSADVDSERLSVIEEMLGKLGARMMRPYEHWNEEEAYREYAERDRGDG